VDSYEYGHDIFCSIVVGTRCSLLPRDGRYEESFEDEQNDRLNAEMKSSEVVCQLEESERVIKQVEKAKIW
jgi:hypothetical protein